MDNEMRLRLDRMLLSDDDKILVHFAGKIVATSITMDLPADEVLNEAIVLVRAQMLKAEEDGTVEKLKRINADLDEFLEKIIHGKY